MQDLALKLLVIAMMAAVGLQLPLTALGAGLSRRAPLALALAVNLVAVPLGVAFVVGQLGLEAGLAAGLILCAAAPGGPTGPVFAQISGGALGFATALMVLLGVIGLVSGPLTVSLLLGEGSGGGELFWPMLRTLALYQILPLALSMALRARAPALAARLAPPVGILANGLLFAIIVGLLITRGQALLEVPWWLHPLLAGALALWLAPGLLLPDPLGILRSVGMVTAVRNLSVALLLSGRFFADPATDVAVLVCGFWMMLLPFALGWLRGRAANGAIQPL